MPSEPDLVLHHVVIKGLADIDAIARATQLDAETVSKVVSSLASDGLVAERTGRVHGYMPTHDGRERHAKVLAESGLRLRQRDLKEWYQRFEAINAEFKEACTAWQLVDGPGGQVPNDHSDEAHDRAVLDRVAVIHHDVGALLAEAKHPRLDRYLARLDDAFAAVQAGDTRRLTTPLCESYHDVWMELHHDLLKSFGRERTAADA